MDRDTPFTEEQQAGAQRIAKLLQLGHKNPNAAEAASALQKAADLALALNLDIEAIGAMGDEGTRLQDKVRGGFYEYQVDIWRYVADLNFVLYFRDGAFIDKRTPRKDRWTGEMVTTLNEVWEKRHGLIGRKHNVATTKAMATYLEQAVDRLLEERLVIRGEEGRFTGHINTQRFSKWAVDFRKGAVADITTRLYERREELLADERKREEEARRRAEEAGMAGASTETALTIASVRQTERDANLDEYYGKPPGTTARERAESVAKAAARAAAQKAAQEEYTKWAAAHPEEARKAEEEARKEREKAEKRRTTTGPGSRGGRGPRDNTDWSAFRAGREAGKSIGLDMQAGGSAKGSLGNG